MSVGKHLVLQKMSGRTAHTVDQRTFKQLTKKLFGFYAQLSGAFGMHGDCIQFENREEWLSVGKHLVLQNKGGRTAHIVEWRTFNQLTKGLFAYHAHLRGAFGMQGDLITVRKSGGVDVCR